MNGKNRSDVYSGLEVDIILKKDQRTGNTTRGIVKDLLTNSTENYRWFLYTGPNRMMRWVLPEIDSPVFLILGSYSVQQVKR